MSVPARDRPGSLLQPIWRWFRTRALDLAALSDGEIKHTAHDLSVPLTELNELARSDPKSANLLKKRMVALNLDCEEVAWLMSTAMRDLQRLCSLYSRRRCRADDLGQTPLDLRCRDYCPNVATLLALDAVPWAARREW